MYKLNKKGSSIAQIGILTLFLISIFLSIKLKNINFVRNSNQNFFKDIEEKVAIRNIEERIKKNVIEEYLNEESVVFSDIDVEVTNKILNKENVSLIEDNSYIYEYKAILGNEFILELDREEDVDLTKDNIIVKNLENKKIDLKSVEEVKGKNKKKKYYKVSTNNHLYGYYYIEILNDLDDNVFYKLWKYNWEDLKKEVKTSKVNISLKFISSFKDDKYTVKEYGYQNNEEGGLYE